MSPIVSRHVFSVQRATRYPTVTFNTTWPAFLTIVSRKADDSHLYLNDAWVKYKHTETWQAASWRVVSQTSKLQTSLGSHNNSLPHSARPKMQSPHPRSCPSSTAATIKCLPEKSIALTTKYILQQYLLKLPRYYGKAFSSGLIFCHFCDVIVSYFFARWDWWKGRKEQLL